MSDLLEELNSLSDDSHSAPAVGSAVLSPTRAGSAALETSEIDAVRTALAALRDGLESERRRLADAAERSKSEHRAFESDQQKLEELLSTLHVEQEALARQRAERKTARAAAPSLETLLAEPAKHENAEPAAIRQSFAEPPPAAAASLVDMNLAEADLESDADAQRDSTEVVTEEMEVLALPPAASAAPVAPAKPRAALTPLWPEGYEARSSLRRRVRIWRRRGVLRSFTALLFGVSLSVMAWSFWDGRLDGSPVGLLMWCAGAIGLIAAVCRAARAPRGARE